MVGVDGPDGPETAQRGSFIARVVADSGGGIPSRNVRSAGPRSGGEGGAPYWTTFATRARSGWLWWAAGYRIDRASQSCPGPGPEALAAAGTTLMPTTRPSIRVAVVACRTQHGRRVRVPSPAYFAAASRLAMSDLDWQNVEAVRRDRHA